MKCKEVKSRIKNFDVEDGFRVEIIEIDSLFEVYFYNHKYKEKICMKSIRKPKGCTLKNVSEFIMDGMTDQTFRIWKERYLKVCGDIHEMVKVYKKLLKSKGVGSKAKIKK